MFHFLFSIADFYIQYFCSHYITWNDSGILGAFGVCFSADVSLVASCLYIVVWPTSLGRGIQPSLMVDIKENCLSSDCLFGAVSSSLDIGGREECALCVYFFPWFWLSFKWYVDGFHWYVFVDRCFVRMPRSINEIDLFLGNSLWCETAIYKSCKWLYLK